MVPPNSPASGDRYHSLTSSKSNSQGGFDPGNLKTTLRGSLPKDDDLTEACAKRKHDQLIAMGGRPTRPVQLQPSWNAVYRHGLVYLYDHEGELEGTLSDDENPMNRHWQNEIANFKSEISLWRRFDRLQQRLSRWGPFDTQLELDHTNGDLVRLLNRLSYWQEFKVFCKEKNVRALISEEAGRSYFLDQMKSEVVDGESLPSSEAHENIRNGLRQFNQSQKEVRSTKAWVDWTMGEWPKLVAESIDAISKTPDLQSVLEARFRKQAYAAFSAIQERCGHPSHAISPPDESMDVLHKILYWSSETEIYKKELVEFEVFLYWRKHGTAEYSSMKRKRGQAPPPSSTLEFFGEFEKFRRWQYNFALNWVKCWQRIVRWYEEEIEMPNPDYEQYTPNDLQHYLEAARFRVIKSEQKLADAARQLEKSVQEHARVLIEHILFCHGKTWIEGQRGEFLSTPPPSISEGSRTPRSSASSCSDCSRSSRSPHSSRSSLSSKSSRSSQSSQSAGSSSKDRNPRMQISSSHKAERRSKKMDIRRSRAKTANLDANTEQQAAPKISPGPQQVMVDDDIKMTDASKDPGAVEGMENEETYMTDPGAVGGAEVKDTDMTDSHDALGYNTLFSSESLSGLSAKIESKKSPISSGNGVASRKTKSVSKPDHTFSGRTSKNVGKKPTKKAKTFTERQAIILLDAASSKSCALESPPLRRSDRLKESLASDGNGVASRKTSPVSNSDRTVSGRIRNNMGKKPIKKAKTFTEQQAIILLDAASSNAVPMDSPQLRRSDRLKEKASASAVTPPSHPNPSPSLQPLEQMQPKRKSVTIKSPRPSRQKKPKIQPDAFETLKDSTQKNSGKQAKTIEQSRSRRQKKLEKRARSAVRPG